MSGFVSYWSTLRRLSWALIAALLAIGAMVLPASPRHIAGAATLTRFVGQVTVVTGPAAAPTGFTFQYKDRFVDMHTSPNATTYQARSAEAEVEGLLPGDYAVVRARHQKKGWTAVLVTFDVRPFANLRPQMVLDGTVTRVVPNQRRFAMRLDGGGTRVVKVAAQARLLLDGQPTDPPPALVKGTVVQVVLRKLDAGWTAVLINIRTSQFFRQTTRR